MEGVGEIKIKIMSDQTMAKSFMDEKVKLQEAIKQSINEFIRQTGGFPAVEVIRKEENTRVGDLVSYEVNVQVTL